MNKRMNEGLGGLDYSLEVEHLHGLCKVLGSVLSTSKQTKQQQNLSESI